MKLLIDMNLSPRWVNFLNDQGIASTHWSTVGAINAPDQMSMSYAREHNYVVITLDLDFSVILSATQGEKPSVVQLRADNSSPDNIDSRVIAALKQMSTELNLGALTTIDANRTRLRVLPLQQRTK
jgi:predicted nuclease of predicted toxin-antitoxin system